MPRASCLPVYQAVMAAGARHGLVNAGYRAIDSLSIEKGEPRVDMVLGSQSRHQEAGDIPVAGV